MLPAPPPPSFWTPAITGFIGLCAGVLLEYFKSGREDVRDLCKGFAQLITDAADVGAEFWLTAADDPKAKLLLARVNGFQRRIDGYLTILGGRLDREAFEEVESGAANLLRCLTGGDPDAPDRMPAFQQACEIHDAAGAVVVSIRRASYISMNLRQRSARFARRFLPKPNYKLKLPPQNLFPGDR